MKIELSYTKIEMLVEFNGIDLLIRNTQWNQLGRAAGVNFEVTSNGTSVKGAAATFVVEQFKKTELWKKIQERKVGLLEGKLKGEDFI